MAVKRNEPIPTHLSRKEFMQYNIEIIVTEKNYGEEVYRRTVTLPEQIGMLEDDVIAAQEAYEEKQDDYGRENM